MARIQGSTNDHRRRCVIRADQPHAGAQDRLWPAGGIRSARRSRAVPAATRSSTAGGTTATPYWSPPRPRCLTPTACRCAQPPPRLARSRRGRARSPRTAASSTPSCLRSTTLRPTPRRARPRRSARGSTVLQDSLGAMYQLTFPTFDKENGIKSADDMRKVKDDLHAHLPDLFKESKQVADYITVDSQWIDGPQGHLVLQARERPRGLHQGQQGPDSRSTASRTSTSSPPKKTAPNTCWSATRKPALPGCCELAKIRSSSTPPPRRSSATTSRTSRAASIPTRPSRSWTTSACPSTATQAARYWIYDYKTMNGTEQKPVVLK